MTVILEILKSIIFGVVQGITEWLPISSTGHLILLNTVMPLKVFEDAEMNLSFWEMYKVVIQFGSILAVVLLYFNKLNPFSTRKSEAQKKATFDLWIKIIIASIPVGIIGFLLDDIVDARLSTPIVVAIMLIVYGVLFIVIELMNRQPKFKNIQEMDYMTAGKIGFFESLALIPGTSRSGSTILGASLLGCSRPMATEFSFFLALPAMLGASVLKLIKMEAPMTFFAFIVLFVGMFVAFIVSVIVIRSFLKYIRKHDFKVFGYYRIFLGILILILVIMKLLPASGLAA
ncbi:MAG: undecaprenyl-diphosphate phosphatase [Solobacterium sp.]|nr:undecaprenyl-diphosphate phosphatase [Solobacterium sp.]